MKILEKYILKEAFKPFLLSVIIVTFIFLIDKIIDLMNLIIEKRLDLPSIISVFSLSLPFIVALSIPMSVLVATIITFGRLSVDNELVAFKSCGINIYKLMRSTVLAAILLTIVMIFFNNDFLPETNHQLKNLLIRLHHRRPVSAIRPGTFTTIKNHTIFAFDVNEDELRRVTIFDKSDGQFPTTITAERGEVILTDGGNNFMAILYNGQIHERDDVDPNLYTVSSFARFTLHLPDLGYDVNVEDTEHRGDREITTKQMTKINEERRKEVEQIVQTIQSIEERNQEIQQMNYIPSHLNRELARNESLIKMSTNKMNDIKQRIREFQVEIHKKYAIAVACLIFVILGVPIGMMIKTSGVGVAFSISTLIFIIYYIGLVTGEQLGGQGQVPPFFAMWTPNIIFAIIGVYLIVKSTKDMATIDMVRWKNILFRFFKKRSNNQ